MESLFEAGALSALLSVIVIDVVLAGDNAIAVGMAAAGLPTQQRRRVILAGTVIATLLRIALAFVAMELLAIIGLTLAGGFLLLFVAWKLYRELREHKNHAAADRKAQPRKSFAQALLQILAADISMSLDNVLAIAGIATTLIHSAAANSVAISRTSSPRPERNTGQNGNLIPTIRKLAA